MKYDVVTIGAATRDIFVTSPLFKIVRDPKHLEKLGFPTGEAQCFALGGKIEVGKPVLSVGGGAANAAVTFARQGFRTGNFMKIGRDENGAAVLRDLYEEKIISLALKDKALGTAYSIILLSPSGERTILNYRGASEALHATEVPWPKLKARLAYISPGHIKPAILGRMIRQLHRAGTFIVINPSKFYIERGLSRLLPILRDVNVVIMNREEAAYLTGVPYERTADIFKKFDEVVSCLAVMTDGAKGVMVSDGTRLYYAGIFRNKRVVDRTGAGDAFGSGFAAGLLRSTPLAASVCVFEPSVINYAIRLGSANATTVVEAVGAQEGILTHRAFERSPRFRKLPITVRAL